MKNKSPTPRKRKKPHTETMWAVLADINGFTRFFCPNILTRTRWTARHFKVKGEGYRVVKVRVSEVKPKARRR